MIAWTGAMLVYGQVRASVSSAIACRTLASAILPEFLTFMTRARVRARVNAVLGTAASLA
jgi:hypothetical protein